MVSYWGLVRERVKTNTYAPREHTDLEKGVDDQWDDAKKLRKLIPSDSEGKDSISWIPQLQDAVFCGHLMADMDSIGGAIAGAYLYDGVAARASEINSETKFALEHWGADSPPPVESFLTSSPNRSVCLVDFQQQTQLNEAIPMSNIVGIIDHHALQSNTIVTEKPIFVDIRPWGCMCSILAHGFAVQGKYLPKNIAGIMLSAILSDTLNLKSPTTTDWDRRMVAMLVQHTGLEDVNFFAAKQFKAKSAELALMSPYSLVNGDFKVFKFTGPTKTHSIGFGVIETTDPASSLARIDELLPEMVETRLEKNLTAMMVAVVDIVQMNAVLLLCGPVERCLGLTAYGEGLGKDGKILELPGLVSRKKDFVPALTKAVADGWEPPASEPSGRRTGRRESMVILSFQDHACGVLTRVYDDDGAGDGDISGLAKLSSDKEEK